MADQPSPMNYEVAEQARSVASLSPLNAILTDFYREEFLKHRQCLRQQREYYSERAITQVEMALAKILTSLEQLCTQEDADELVSRLLRKFDLVTGLSNWTDPAKLH